MDGPSAGIVQEKKLISLDQNFLWSFTTRKNPGLVKLRDSLLDAVGRQRALCPIHVYETIVETSMVPAELQRGIFATAEELSTQTGFHHFGTLLGFETLQLVRSGFKWPPLQQGSLIQPDGSLSELGAEYRALKRDYAVRLSAVSYSSATHDPKMKVDQIEQALDQARAGFMYRLVQSIVETGTLETRMTEWEYTNDVGRFLLSEQITGGECTLLIDAIKNRHWDAIPVLHAHTRLCACLAVCRT